MSRWYAAAEAVILADDADIDEGGVDDAPETVASSERASS
jgi:hypothetical protein